MNSKKYKHIIDQPGRTYELARQMIPVLISWAQEGKSPQYYSTLSKAIGHKTDQIGRQMGAIGWIFKNLSKESGRPIPLLNGFVMSKANKRPSDGLSEFVDGYNTWSEKKKIAEANKINEKAYSYKNWKWVLDALDLMPYNSQNEESIRKGIYKKDSSEGKLHKQLKEHILNHPEVLGIKDVKKKDYEFVLLSGDRLDVYFLQQDGKQIAVEVKSRISDDADILRGIYQCVKYKAVLAAECHTKGEKADVDSILVVEKELSKENIKAANILNVKHIVYDGLK